MADISAILTRLDQQDERIAALEAEVNRTRTDVGSWLQSERAWNGVAGYRIAGSDAVHVLSFAPSGPFLTRLSPALFDGMKGRGDVDPVVFDVEAGSALAAELEAMPGFDPR